MWPCYMGRWRWWAACLNIAFACIVCWWYFCLHTSSWHSVHDLHLAPAPCTHVSYFVCTIALSPSALIATACVFVSFRIGDIFHISFSFAALLVGCTSPTPAASLHYGAYGFCCSVDQSLCLRHITSAGVNRTTTIAHRTHVSHLACAAIAPSPPARTSPVTPTPPARTSPPNILARIVCTRGGSAEYAAHPHCSYHQHQHPHLAPRQHHQHPHYAHHCTSQHCPTRLYTHLLQAAHTCAPSQRCSQCCCYSPKPHTKCTTNHNKSICMFWSHWHTILPQEKHRTSKTTTNTHFPQHLHTLQKRSKLFYVKKLNENKRYWGGSHFGSTDLQALINKTMKEGKKTKAEKIVYGAMNILGDDALNLFEKSAFNLTPDMEVRYRKVRKVLHAAPNT